MKRWKTISITGLILASLCFGGVVQAKHYDSNIDQREAEQQQRIQEGLQSGALTPQEAARLEAEQQQIQALKAKMLADGKLSPKEKVTLDQLQEKADRDIYRLKHNNQVAYPRCDNNRCEKPWRVDRERERYWRDKERHHEWER